jgi:FemAB-related protein (PEP-CTERM system-associated)
MVMVLQKPAAHQPQRARAAVRIRELDDHASPGVDEVWEVFVRSMPEATFFHLPAWRKVIKQAFGHATHYAYAEQDGAITGVLPLARMRTRLFGDALISTPFCVYGGPVSATPEAAQALEEHALALMRRTGVPLLEFRRRDAADPGWPERPPLHYTFRRAITGNADADMKAIPRKQRAMVRKGIQNGLTSISNSDTRALHGVYAEMVHALGTPVFAERYFRLLADAFPGAHDVTTVLHEGRAVASVLNFHFRDEVLPYYGGGGRAARGLAANDFLYWEVMRRAGAERGARLFDFGRSKKDTGAFDFKRNWGFTPEPLHYCYQLREGATLPENNPSNPKYRLMIKAWRRLPISLANRIGPYIVRGLG